MISEVLIKNTQKFCDDLVLKAKKEQADFLVALESELIAKNEAIFEKIVAENEEASSQRAALARLDASKTILKAKQNIVDKVFNEAKNKILSLPDKKYLESLEKLITVHAENEDIIVFSKKDIQRIPKNFVDDIAAKSKLQLNTTTDTHEDDGGIILKSKNYDKSLTISALIDLARQNKQSDVLKVLFYE